MVSGAGPQPIGAQGPVGRRARERELLSGTDVLVEDVFDGGDAPSGDATARDLRGGPPGGRCQAPRSAMAPAAGQSLVVPVPLTIQHPPAG